MSDGAVKRKSSTSSASSAIPFHFLAGLGSGIFSAFLLQPADLLKTRVQQANTPSSSSLRFALRQVLNGPHPLRALWRGTTPSVIRTGFGSAMYFGMLNQMRQYAAKIPPVAGPDGVAGGGGAGGTSDGKKSSSSSALPKLGNTANLTTGALARVAAGFILNPVTVLKVRYESSQFAYTSLTGAARDILRREGPRGFFAGFGVTAARDAPYAGLYVLLYEQAKARLGGLAAASSTKQAMGGDGRGLVDEESKKATTTMSSSVSINFVSGAFAATAATAITNPFDAVKTRLQLAPAKYRNMLQTARMMLRDEGVKSMFSGLSLRVGRKAVSSALTWTVYEEVIRRVERAFV